MHSWISTWASGDDNDVDDGDNDDDLYMGLSQNVRLMIGHQFEDFIKECTFLGSDCLNIRSFIVDNSEW